MARLGLIQRNLKRERLVKKYSKKRFALKKIIKNKTTSSDERIDAINKLFKGKMTHYDPNSLNLFSNKNQTNLDSFYKELGWERSKKICTVFSHNLFDGNYNNDWRIFRDNLTWLRETLHLIKDSKQNINWIIKEHPSEYGKKKR